MSDITISVIQPPSTTINVGVDETTLVQAGIGLPPHLVTHISGGSDELNHNLLAGLQGGSDGQYYHLSSGQYFNLTTGSVVRPSETGAFYPRSNPSGYITGLDLSSYSTISFSTGISGHLQNQVTYLNNQTGSYYLISNPSGYITGVDLSSYVTGDVVRPSQTGAFYPSSNPSGFITGIDLSAYVTGAVIRPSDTGAFYPTSNPSGFITVEDSNAIIGFSIFL